MITFVKLFSSTGFIFSADSARISNNRFDTDSYRWRYGLFSITVFEDDFLSFFLGSSPKSYKFLAVFGCCSCNCKKRFSQSEEDSFSNIAVSQVDNYGFIYLLCIIKISLLVASSLFRNHARIYLQRLLVHSVLLFGGIQYKLFFVFLCSRKI